MNTVEQINDYFLAEAQRAKESGETPHQLKVLIIDDDPTFNNMVEAALHKHGALVDVAVDGATGHWKSFLGAYDLILLDMKMPGVDGVQVLKRIKEDRPNARVVICTGFASPETIAAATQFSPLGVIEKKPEDMEQLMNVFKHYNLLRQPAAPPTPG